MGFGNRRGGGGGGGGRKGEKGEFRKLGALMESRKTNGQFFAADKYQGCLLFVDKESKRVYKINTANFSDRDTLEDRGIKNLPDSVLGNISINLNSDKSVEEIDLDKLNSFDDLFDDEEDNRGKRGSRNRD